MAVQISQEVDATKEVTASQNISPAPKYFTEEPAVDLEPNIPQNPVLTEVSLVLREDEDTGKGNTIDEAGDAPSKERSFSAAGCS